MPSATKSKAATPAAPRSHPSRNCLRAHNDKENVCARARHCSWTSLPVHSRPVQGDAQGRSHATPSPKQCLQSKYQKLQNSNDCADYCEKSHTVLGLSEKQETWSVRQYIPKNDVKQQKNPTRPMNFPNVSIRICYTFILTYFNKLAGISTHKIWGCSNRGSSLTGSCVSGSTLRR
jgi:hypothetical protein